MSFSNTDLLRHVLDEAEFIIQNLDGLSVEKLGNDPILQRAFIRSFQVIGETSKTVQEGFRLKYPQLEWRNMARMRDRLIHHYFDVDFQVLYDTCIIDIPELAFTIKAIILLEDGDENEKNSN